MENEIKYFSMFTGVGGFERGFERANNISKKQGLQQGRDESQMLCLWEDVEVTKVK